MSGAITISKLQDCLVVVEYPRHHLIWLEVKTTLGRHSNSNAESTAGTETWSTQFVTIKLTTIFCNFLSLPRNSRVYLSSQKQPSGLLTWLVAGAVSVSVSVSGA